MLINKNY